MSAEFNDVGRKIDDALLTGLRAHFEGSSRTERPALSSETMRVRSFGFDQIPSVLKLWPNPKERTRIVSERSEEHTSELQSLTKLLCRLRLEKKKTRTGASGER